MHLSASKMPQLLEQTQLQSQLLFACLPESIRSPVYLILSESFDPGIYSSCPNPAIHGENTDLFS